MLTSEGHVKLCDFGSAILIEGSRMLPTSTSVSSTGTSNSEVEAARKDGGTKNAFSSHSGVIRVRRPALDPSDLLVTSTVMKNSEEKQGGAQRGSEDSRSPGVTDSHSHLVRAHVHAHHDRDDKQHQQQDEEEKDQQREEQNTSQNASFVGSSEYVSPEVLRNQPVSAGSDMWALGCIIYKLFTGIASPITNYIIYTLLTYATLSTHLRPITGRSPFLVDGSEYLTFQNIMSHATLHSTNAHYPHTLSSTYQHILSTRLSYHRSKSVPSRRF